MTGPSSGFGCRLQLSPVSAASAGGPAAAAGRGCCSDRGAVRADGVAMRRDAVAAAVAVPPASLPQCRRPLLSQSIRLPVVVHPPPGGCGIVAICGQDTSSSRSESDAHASSQFDPGPAVHGFCLPLPLYSCPADPRPFIAWPPAVHLQLSVSCDQRSFFLVHYGRFTSGSRVDLVAIASPAVAGTPPPLMVQHPPATCHSRSGSGGCLVMRSAHCALLQAD